MFQDTTPSDSEWLQFKKKLNNYLSSSRHPFIKQFDEPVSVVNIHFGIDEITDTEN